MSQDKGRCTGYFCSDQGDESLAEAIREFYRQEITLYVTCWAPPHDAFYMTTDNEAVTGRVQRSSIFDGRVAIDAAIRKATMWLNSLSDAERLWLAGEPPALRISKLQGPSGWQLHEEKQFGTSVLVLKPEWVKSRARG